MADELKVLTGCVWCVHACACTAGQAAFLDRLSHWPGVPRGLLEPRSGASCPAGAAGRRGKSTIFLALGSSVLSPNLPATLESPLL